ncbi:MAG: FIG00672996: hypothetical protein, partial [uncultured Rubrobacteraceae bacterium]
DPDSRHLLHRRLRARDGLSGCGRAVEVPSRWLCCAVGARRRWGGRDPGDGELQLRPARPGPHGRREDRRRDRRGPHLLRRGPGPPAARRRGRAGQGGDVHGLWVLRLGRRRHWGALRRAGQHPRRPGDRRRDGEDLRADRGRPGGAAAGGARRGAGGRGRLAGQAVRGAAGGARGRRVRRGQRQGHRFAGGRPPGSHKGADPHPRPPHAVLRGDGTGGRGRHRRGRARAGRRVAPEVRVPRSGRPRRRGPLQSVDGLYRDGELRGEGAGARVRRPGGARVHEGTRL